jgi:hypothetical protein
MQVMNLPAHHHMQEEIGQAERDRYSARIAHTCRCWTQAASKRAVPRAISIFSIFFQF